MSKRTLIFAVLSSFFVLLLPLFFKAAETGLWKEAWITAAQIVVSGVVIFLLMCGSETEKK